MVTPPVLMVVPSLVMDVFSQVGPYAFLPPLKLKPLLAMFISSVVYNAYMFCFRGDGLRVAPFPSAAENSFYFALAILDG